MSSLPPSTTPSAGDDSLPESLLETGPAPETPQADAAAPDAGDDAPATPEIALPEAATSEPAASDPAAADSPATDAASPAGEAAPQQDCGPQLKQLYPALFSNPPKPLKLRIQSDIQARSPGRFTKPQLSAFLRRYTGSHGYLNAIVKATHRYDLDGNPGDALSDEHRQAAVDELARRRDIVQARRALEDEQRFNRATLLREFGVNTLPPAEFATARGIPEAELEPLLARARQEAAEPPAPPRHDRRGPPPQRQGQPRRNDRPPRQGAPAQAAPVAGAEGDAVAPAPRSDAPRGPRPDAPRGPRNDAPRGPRTDAPRGPRADAPRGLRPDAPRQDGPRGPRPEGQRGPRPDGPRGNPNGPRAEAPRGARNDGPRGPRPDAPRNVVSSPATPTAMALAFSALRDGAGGKSRK